ncbi:MAG TPA: LptF/LptG family permease, partial [Opitutaceae bacterium]|nr:LptF/LptG family permease [Opitutaceae bacterium]
MNLLDRHIFKSVFFSCAAAVLMFTFILVVGSVVRDLVGNVLAGQLPLLKFVELTVMTAPYVASYALPLGMLTGVLLTLGRLSSDSEITAMRAAGISMVRIARPVLLLGAVGAAIALWINFQSMPKAKVRYEHELTETLRANPIGFIVPKTFIREFPGWVLYIGDKQKGILRDFWAWQLDSDRRVVHFVHAASGHMSFDESADDLIVTLANGQAEDLNDRNPENFAEAPPVATFEVS